VTHYFGAALLTMTNASSNSSGTTEGSSQRDVYRNLLNAVAFGTPNSLPIATYKPSCETNVDKGIFVSRGQDTFESILLGAGFSDDVDNGKIKVIALVV
jgi:hypothetical protein